MTALNQVMRDIEQHYPNLFDLNTAQGREFVSRFYKYLEIEKEQIIKAHGIQRFHNIKQGIDFWDVKTGEQYYNETYK